jgi:TonB family protein
VAPLPSVPKRNKGDEDAALRRFQQEIVRIVGKVVSERDYPRLAKERGWQGSPMIRVEIGEDGKLKLVAVAKTSGFSLLDERAVSKIKEIRLPKIPEEFRDRAFGVDVPFKFWLRDRDKDK